MLYIYIVYNYTFISVKYDGNTQAYFISNLKAIIFY